MGSLIHKLDYLAETKVKIREALKFKGEKVTEEDTFRSYAEFIRKIQGMPCGVAGDLEAMGSVGVAGRALKGEAQWVIPLDAIPDYESIEFIWKPISEAVSYAVSWYTLNPITLVSRVQDIDASVNSYKVEGLTSGTEYAVVAFYKDETMSNYKYMTTGATDDERVAHGLTAIPF